MKAKFKQVGLGDARHMLVISTDGQYTHGITLDNGTSVIIPSTECAFYDIEQPTIDWEQRRYEIAKDVANGIVAGDRYLIKDLCGNEDFLNDAAICRLSIRLANELVRQLKEPKNKQQL